MRYSIVALLVSIFMVSCGNNNHDEEEDTEVIREVIAVEEVAPEPEPVVEEMPEPEPEPEPEPIIPNKYFLIAGSFSTETNANKFRDDLIQQGFEAEVVVRMGQVNEDYYKVSYKGFSDRAAAFAQLKEDKNTAGSEDVWLLIK